MWVAGCRAVVGESVRGAAGLSSGVCLADDRCVEYLATEQIPLADLAPFPGWPDIAGVGDVVEEIRQSLRTIGQARSLAVREVGGGGRRMVLADHVTYAAMLAEDWPSARCEIFACSDLEAGEVAGLW